MMLRPVVCLLFVVGVVLPVLQAQTWQPSPGHRQIPIWPQGKIPDARPMKGPEVMKIAAPGSAQMIGLT